MFTGQKKFIFGAKIQIKEARFARNIVKTRLLNLFKKVEYPESPYENKN